MPRTPAKTTKEPKSNVAALHSDKAKSRPSATASPRRKATENGAMSVPDRRELVAVAAYYLAQRRGFGTGSELEDWLQAEREVDLMLGEQQGTA